MAISILLTDIWTPVEIHGCIKDKAYTESDFEREQYFHRDVIKPDFTQQPKEQWKRRWKVINFHLILSNVLLRYIVSYVNMEIWIGSSSILNNGTRAFKIVSVIIFLNLRLLSHIYSVSNGHATKFNIKWSDKYFHKKPPLSTRRA